MTKPLEIVAATDLSPRGELALRRSFELLGERGGSLTVLHVVDDVFPEPVAVHLRREAEKLLQDQIEPLRAAHRGPKLDIAISLGRGRPAAVIAEFCEAKGADLLVAGTPRGDPIWRALHGATIHRALTIADVPALVVRAGGSAAPALLLAAVDFSIASERALRVAREVYPAAKVALVHALDVIESAFIPAGSAERYRAQVRAAAQAELEAFARRLGLDATLDQAIISLGEPAQLILDHAARLGAPLIVLGTHGRTGIGHVLLGSVALAAMDRAEGDVLVARAW
jgi:nucleotide-binding universal stress UspA family protein